ncbi:MAG: alpha/beta fold hydrolase [Acidobacteria bacterium]|nr:MAG: alpha/beta fold hydrolase [Acidobacteriota bacterium]
MMNRPVSLLSLLLLVCAVPAPAPRAGAALPEPPAGPVEHTVELVTPDDVRLEGVLLVPAQTAERPRPPAGWPVAILVHGHAKNRDGLLPLADALAARGIAVAVLDQRGHGGSRSTARTRSIYAFPVVPESHIRREVGDQLLLAESLAERDDLDFNRVALVGIGLGGLVAAEASWKLPHVRALVMVDPAVPVAGLDPRRDLALFGERPVLFACSGFPQPQARARALAEYGHGERTVRTYEIYDALEQLVAEGRPSLADIVDWLAGKLTDDR